MVTGTVFEHTGMTKIMLYSPAWIDNGLGDGE